MVIVNDEKTIKNLLENKGITLLYFASPTCSACPVIKAKLKMELIKFPKISAYEIPPFNTEKILADFNIFTFPAILIYIDGKEYLREARYFSVEKLIRDIERYYKLSQ